MITLRYANTNTYFMNGLLVDTAFAGTLPLFFKALGENGLSMQDIKYLLITHYHPDHMGLAGELVSLGAKLMIADVQKAHVHFSDYIFTREKLPFVPVDISEAVVITCEQSREFLGSIGVVGQIIHTPSHSEDSISLILDNGSCIVGDLEPYEYIEAYEDNFQLISDWENIRSFAPKRIYYAHRPPVEI